MPQFQNGDRVQFTKETRDWNPRARSITGVVINANPNCSGHIRVRRDDLKSIEYWNESAWEPISEKNLEFLTRSRTAEDSQCNQS